MSSLIGWPWLRTWAQPAGSVAELIAGLAQKHPKIFESTPALIESTAEEVED